MKVGFFGKLPGYGDFVQRNVSPDLVEYWDNWLLQSIDISRDQLKQAWQDKYFTSPVWRFTLQHGLAGNRTVSGLMMPSVDASGRCYPFCVFCESQRPFNVFNLAAELEPMHLLVEEIMIDLLNKARPDLDELAEVLRQHYSAFQPAASLSIQSVPPAFHTELGHVSSPTALTLNQRHAVFYAAMLKQQELSVSMWAHSASEDFNYVQRYFCGMPPVEAFASLLDDGEPTNP